MSRILGYRLLQAVLVALVVGVLTFILTRALPGDMAFCIAAGRYGYDYVDAVAAAAVRSELGLDQPALLALGQWLWDLLRLDLGRSLVSGDPVIEEVGHQLGHSLELALAAILVARLAAALRLSLGLALLGVVSAALPGVLLGIVAGWRRGWTERGLVVLADACLALLGLLVLNTCTLTAI